MILWLGLLGCSEGVTLTEAQKAEVRVVADAARAANEPLEQTRKSAILAARGKLGPRPDIGPCTARIVPPLSNDVGSFADEGVTFALSTAPISVVAAADIDKSDGPRWDRVQNVIVNDVEAMLIGAYRADDLAQIDEKFAIGRSLTDVGWIPFDTTLVVDRYIPAKIEPDAFTGGLVVGRMYVYDYRSQQIVCAAAVRAENSDTLGVHLQLDTDDRIVGAGSDAVRDLYRNGVMAGFANLAAAGPLLFAISP